MDYTVCLNHWRSCERRVVSVVCSQGISKSSHEDLKRVDYPYQDKMSWVCFVWLNTRNGSCRFRKESDQVIQNSVSDKLIENKVRSWSKIKMRIWLSSRASKIHQRKKSTREDKLEECICQRFEIEVKSTVNLRRWCKKWLFVEWRKYGGELKFKGGNVISHIPLNAQLVVSWDQ